MYDVENKKLLLCNSTDQYKYYFNISRSNVRNCFKYDYECPDVYHYLNTTINECIDYSPPVPTPSPSITTNIQTEEKKTKATDIKTTIPEIIPTTYFQEQCKYGISINYTSSYSDLTNDELYDITRNNIISFYCSNGSSVILEGSNGNSF